jgi:hypothetical protein
MSRTPFKELPAARWERSRTRCTIRRAAGFKIRICKEEDSG